MAMKLIDAEQVIRKIVEIKSGVIHGYGVGGAKASRATCDHIIAALDSFPDQTPQPCCQSAAKIAAIHEAVKTWKVIKHNDGYTAGFDRAMREIRTLLETPLPPAPEQP
jgi:hypothetical protein